MTTTGSLYGRYRLEEKLGEGGMAEAWRAVLVDTENGTGFEKRVCLKRVLPEHAATPLFVDMFRDEARIAARLQHQNIVQVFELGQAEGTFFIAMELVDGTALNQLLKKGVRASVPQALAIAAALTAALAYAHDATVDGKPLELIHRDVTPENVLLGKNGDLKLSDFGIARARDRLTKTKTGVIKGKLSYMAPEQARAEDIDQRVDQWAAGVVVWEILTGRPLFRRKGELAILQAVTRDPIPPPSSLNPAVPASVDAVVLRALRRPREQRWATMGAFHDALAAELLQIQRSPRDADLRPLVAAVLDDNTERVARVPDPGAVGDAHGATVSDGAALAFHDDDRTVSSQVGFDDDEHKTLPSEPLKKLAPPSTKPPKTASTMRPAPSSSSSSSSSNADQRGLWVVGGVVAGIVVVGVVLLLAIVGGRS